MAGLTKTDGAGKKQASSSARPQLSLDDAVSWLAEHLGYPARSRADFESREPRRPPVVVAR